MAKDDWFRRKTWSRLDEEQFLARLARSRSVANKSQYVRIQAVTLREHGLIEPAIGLLNRVINEWPDQLQLAASHLDLAMCYSELRQPERAIPHFRESLATEAVMPNVLTRCWLLFPWFILSNDLTRYFEEGERVISDREGTRGRDFPIDIYQWAAAKALFSEHQGDRSSAERFALIAWDAAQMGHSGYRYHPEIGLVVNPPNAIHSRISKLAGKDVSLVSKVMRWLQR